MGKTINEDILKFFQAQGYVIVSTIDKGGSVHNACKGIIEINRGGKAYLLDLYHGETFKNLSENPSVSVTAIDEHKFKGYSLQGKAKIVTADELKDHLLKAWEEKITSRITRRLIKNLYGEKGHPKHPEALLPNPKYMIAVDIEAVVDLTPHHIKQEA